ncbi:MULTISPECIES: hypothetical protein [Mycobacteriaceae]|uniref:Uncharacterized protein n=1 Tax=Mycolicibacterium mucogenicum DSM 44124 TaxID=1226753 RepID=A0A8H2JIV6_MYCMU|nr:MULTISPECIES: hypothetical protein [Mycobacteriaceae]QPG68979.1 hypothetical protein C1S78_026855 [Mycolicibacterium mucogenicum DSM 44124]SEA77758.1 hypothetical protein SAMN04488580_104293 [Mycobacterium sp. 283mftsu]
MAAQLAEQVTLVAAAGTEGGGAALDQVIGMSVATGIITAGLLWIGYLHRQRRITWLKDLADKAGRKMNRPSWVALPSLLFISTIICAMFGFIWDVSLHIGKGRDAGPLANPAHYFILVGLFLLFIAGSLSIILPYDKPGPAAIKITKTWYAPVGGVLMAGCGLYALIGFPLDDIWHRIFGQDVTLWGPTHLMLIGGAGLSLVATLLLEREGDIAMGSDAPAARNKVLPYLAFGGLVIGLSVFPVEYDFGVEQFRLVLHPMLIAAAAAMSLVATRLTLGRFSTFGAIAFSWFIRGLVILAVGPILGSPYSWFALYLGSAVVVELIGLTPLVNRPILFGAVAGLGVGTVGMWLESFWVDSMFRTPWPSSMWGEALTMSTPVAIGMGMCGALLAIVLSGQRLPARPIGIGIVVATVVVIGAAVTNGLNVTVPEHARAQITLSDAPSPAGERLVNADIQITPANLVSDDPEWVTLMAWQGKLANERGLVVDHLQQVGPGHYRSTRPIPVWGTWKTVLRVQDGRTMAAVPVYLPADPGIGAEETPAISTTRDFMEEIKVLQRERNLDVPSWLYPAASLIVLVCSLILIALLSWGAGRINSREQFSATETREPVGQP